MYVWPYQPPYYYAPIPQHKGQTSEFEWNRAEATGLDNLTRILENQLAVTHEILSLVRQNHEMLRMLTSSSEEPIFQHPAVSPQQPMI